MGYNQNIINVYGEDRIKHYIVNGVTLDYTSTNESNIFLKNAIEHYILKYIDAPHDSNELNAMRNYVINVANQFRKNNTIISNSIFFTKDNLEKIYGKAHWFEELKTVRSEFTKRAYSLYNKSLKEELTDEERTILMAFFNTSKETENESIKLAMEEYAIRLFAKNEIPSNTEEFRFIMNYASRYGLYVTNTKIDDFPEVYITAMTKKENDGSIVKNKTMGGYYNHGQIFINANADRIYKPDLLSYIKTVCHETQHALQDYKASQHPDSVVALEYAEWRLFRKYYNNSNDSIYKNNYKYVEIEIDAENQGYHRTEWIYGRLAQSESIDERTRQELRNLRDINRARKTEYEKERPIHYEYAVSIDGKPIRKETFNVEQLNKIIKEHPEELENYPSLNKLYHEDGSLRSFEEMITSDIFVNQSESSKMFEDYLIYAIDKLNALEMFNFSILNKLPIEKQANFFKRIISLFDKETDKLISFTEDPELDKNSNIRENQIKAISNYHMKIAIKLSNFIDNNYYFIRQLSKEGEYISQVGYNATMYKNNLEAIIYKFEHNQNSVFQETVDQNLDEFRKKYHQVTNINRLIYVQEKLGMFDNDVLDLRVSLPNGAEISLRQYAEEYITSRMDSNYYFVDENGQKMHVMDVINTAIIRANQVSHQEVREWIQTNQPQNEYIEQLLSQEDLSQSMTTSKKR